MEKMNTFVAPKQNHFFNNLKTLKNNGNNQSSGKELYKDGRI